MLSFNRLIACLIIFSTLVVFPFAVEAQDDALNDETSALIEQANEEGAVKLTDDPKAHVAKQMEELSVGLVETVRNAVQGDDKALRELTDQYLIPAALVIILMIVGYIVASFVGRIVGGVITRKVDKTLGMFSAKMIRNVIMMIVLLGVLSHFNIDVTSFAAILAAAGFAVGMALQGTLGNFAAGIMLLIFRPFKVDDYVKLGDCEGNVQEIGLFTTHIDTLDNRRLIIPNGQINGETMVHYTKNELRRVDVNVGAEYGADLKYTRRTLESALENIVGADENSPTQVYLCDLGDSSVNWQCRVWCKPAVYWDVRERVTESVKESLDQAGIGIPFPQMDVNVVGKVLAKAAA